MNTSDNFLHFSNFLNFIYIFVKLYLYKPAIAQHAHVTGHRSYWEPMMIEREQNGGRRKVNEALHIHRMKK